MYLQKEVMMDFKNGTAAFIMPHRTTNFSFSKPHLEETLTALFDQSDQNFIIIIVDDGSPIKEYKKFKQYIDLLNKENIILKRFIFNKGPGHRRNIGIKIANKMKVPFVLFNDSDDISHPNRLMEVRNIFISKPSVGVVYSSFITIDENSNKVKLSQLVPSLKLILEGHLHNPINEKNAWVRIGTEKNYTNLTSATAVRTDLAIKHLFPKRMVSEDAHTWLRYAAEGDMFYYTSYIPTKYRVRLNGSSGTRERINDFYKEKCKVDELGFKEAIKIASKKEHISFNQKKELLFKFYNCLYDTVVDEAGESLKKSLQNKIKKYRKRLEIFIPDQLINQENKCFNLHVIVPQPEGSIGGSDSHVLSLSEQQLKTGALIPIVFFTHNQSYRDELKRREIPYIYAGNIKGWFSILNHLKDIPKKYNINIIHSHQYNANYLTVMIKYLKLWKKIPVVMTCHGWIENTFKLKVMTFFDFCSYFFCKSLIVVSKDSEQRIKRNIFFKSKIIEYIPNGVNTTTKLFNKDILKMKYNLPKDKIIVSYVGRLSSEKRVDIFIEIAKSICERSSKAVFIIVGNGLEKKKLEEKVEVYKLGKAVLFLGYVKQIEEIHFISDIIMLTSDSEGTPRAILEAMSYQTVPICTNVGGLKEIIINDNNGLLVEKQNIKDLTTFLMSLIENDSKRMKLSKKARDTVNTKFNIEGITTQINRLYEKIIK